MLFHLFKIAQLRAMDKKIEVLQRKRIRLVKSLERVGYLPLSYLDEDKTNNENRDFNESDFQTNVLIDSKRIDVNTGNNISENNRDNEQDTAVCVEENDVVIRTVRLVAYNEDTNEVLIQYGAEIHPVPVEECMARKLVIGKEADLYIWNDAKFQFIQGGNKICSI